MNQYKLLTPGPLTTTETVKEEMLLDRCTWDYEYKSITQKIRAELLELAGVSSQDYTTILMQGSGTFTVESVMTTALSIDDKALIVTNGTYGERIVEMADYIGLNYIQYGTPYNEQPDISDLENLLEGDPDITHIVMVHCETTSGILNPLEDISALSKKHQKSLIVDAMSSFGGIPMDIGELGIDYLISSANKCIQGVPGFGFVIANTDKLKMCKGNARSLSLDLYAQWEEMNKDGKWRYTSPTHVVAAFSKAIDELMEEGGVEARFKRYAGNNQSLRDNLEYLGFKAYIGEAAQSPIITTFLFPSEEFDFEKFYLYVKERGFVLYPGKLTEVNTFRIGNIGEVYEKDIKELCNVIQSYIGEVIR